MTKEYSFELEKPDFLPFDRVADYLSCLSSLFEGSGTLILISAYQTQTKLRVRFNITGDTP